MDILDYWSHIYFWIFPYSFQLAYWGEGSGNFLFKGVQTPLTRQFFWSNAENRKTVKTIQFCPKCPHEKTLLFERLKYMITKYLTRKKSTSLDWKNTFPPSNSKSFSASLFWLRNLFAKSKISMSKDHKFLRKLLHYQAVFCFDFCGVRSVYSSRCLS